MEPNVVRRDQDRRRSGIFTIVLIAFLAIAGFYLIAEHRAHLLGWLPWLLILACPLLHIFMHGSHGGHGGRTDSGNDSAPPSHHQH
jgi:hypothetical protein